MSPQEAAEILGLKKNWPSQSLAWVKTQKKKLPQMHKVHTALLHNGTVLEGTFVDILHMSSPIAGLPDKLSISLIAQKFRILGIDDGRHSKHINKVGIGHPHHQKQVPHPHIHRPVDASDLAGYAEPLPAQSAESLWRLFTTEANIEAAPKFERPAIQADWI